MRIPSQVMMGRHNIRVKLKNMGSGTFGRVHTGSLKIDINSNVCRSMQEETLIHELVHAISTIYGLNMTEHQVSVLSACIYSNIMPLEIK